jgi:hypothetical protein
MFEKEIERVRKQLGQQLETRQPYTSLSAILANHEIHPAYRTYFSAEVQWWLHEERAIRASNPRFDISVPQLQQSLAALDALYLQHARFDHEELLSTIEAAAKTRFNFLCRPRTTLKWFVFRGEPTKPLYEILLRLSYLSDHDYLLGGIRSWAESRGDTSTNEILSVIEFERIIEKIDNDAILDLSQEEFVQLLEPMYQLFADVHPDLPPETVPTEAVIIFLDDKGAVPLSQALERMLYREELRALTRKKFMEVIDAVIATIDEAAAEPPAEVFMQANMPVEAETSQMQQDHENVLQMRRDKLASLLDDESRSKVLRKIFDNDTHRYEELVREVLLCPSWKEAAGVIDRFYAKNGTHPDSAVAMEFAQALHRSIA